ncbi:methionyl-tRNA formyltransferase [Candidatus Woesearchaeota archaeon]|nr:methionyl-tRNA formyltransferase [Candidatus Woesearchaeota archaeon]
MRTAFIGALIGGYDALKALLDNGITIDLVFTLDEHYAENVSCFQLFDPLFKQYNVPYSKIKDINDPENILRLKNLKPDLMIVNCWSQLLTKEILDIPSIGVLGMHPTLLPKHRGRAPIPWALIHGLDKTGVTWFFYNEKPDAGDIVAQREIPITFQDTAMSLGKKVDTVAIELLIEAVKSIQQGIYKRIPQDHTQATYWKRRRPEDGIIDWNKTNLALYNWVRALTRPYPGAFTYHNGKKLFVWKASLPLKDLAEVSFTTEDVRTSGTIMNVDPDGITVSTGQGNLILEEVQYEDEPVLNLALATLHFQIGEVLGNV